jgi:hypothetical protein
MSTKGNRQKVEYDTFYQGLQCQLRATDRSVGRLPLVDIDIPVRKYRCQPSVGCPQLTLKSLLDSIVLNLLSVALSGHSVN